MGVYLNSKSPFGLFFDEAASTYYVDKSSMILDLLPLVEDSRDVFDRLKVCRNKEAFGKHMNKHNVIYFCSG